MKARKVKICSGLSSAVLLITPIIFFMGAGFMGCNDYSLEHNSQSLEIGFGDIGIGEPLGPVQYAVRSDNSIFKANNVTLNFYFSGQKYIDGTIDGGGSENYTCIGFAIYFCDGQYYSQPRYPDGFSYAYNTYDDYQHIDNWHFVREMSIEEFRSSEYSVFFGDKIRFNHCETIRVPHEVFERESGTFTFQVVGINYSKIDNGYCINDLGYFLVIKYEYIDEQTIHLSAYHGSSPQ